MKRFTRIAIVVFIMLLAFTKARSQNSNIGTEFWTGYMDHINGVTGSTGSQMNLYIAADVATTVTISCSNGSFSSTVNVSPGIITTFPVPTSTFLGNTSGIQNKGIHIVSQKPVAVYAHIYASSVSGATLLLPVNTLSNDYYSLNYTQLSNASATVPAYSTFMVIATDDNTTVQITPTGTLLDSHPAGSTFTITLQKGEIYQGVSATDLTGSHISVVSGASGCKKVAMFSGSSKIKIGTPNVTSDNLFQQVYPTPSWGKNYITVPLKNRNYDVFRVMVSDPTAVVKRNGNTLTGLVAGFYYEYNSQTSDFITADKPVQVVQYAVTQSNSINGTNVPGDVGDPEMIYLNPLEQNIDHVTLYSAPEYDILQSYINVVIPTASASTFLLDGVAPAGGFTVAPNNTAYSYGRFNVSNTTHVISAAAGFNAIAYGFGGTESYGYAAGTNVKNLNEYVQYVDPVTKTVEPSSCTGSTLTPEIVLPYITSQITWDFGDNVTDVSLNPSYTQVIAADGVTPLYKYDYAHPITYATAGTYNIKATAIDPISTICGSNDDVFLTFTIVDPPQAKLTVPTDNACLGDVLTFTDQTDGSVNTVKTWLWNFGDGNTSNLQNPTHAYTQAGDFTVTLTTTGTTGCSTTAAAPTPIHVRALPAVNFVTQGAVCESPLMVTFTDQSTTAEGAITTWLWDFGDSTPSSAQNPTHTYATAGTYQVVLTVTTDKGCANSKTVAVKVNPAPVVDFSLPDACIADVSKFTSLATVSDGEAFTNTWTFGDIASNISVANPNTATGTTVNHKYADAGTYNVTLTVTTANGCIISTTKQFTVNGKFPVAAFDAPASMCSNQDVVFVDQAIVPGFNGKVTSFIMDFGDGTTPQTYRLNAGESFTHTYPISYTTSKTYTVKMTAFSGASVDCMGTISHDVTLLPIPQATFTPPATICQNSGTIQLADYVTQTNTGGPAGVPGFSIDGTASTNGVFNTATIGVGAHTITCNYVSPATLCSYTIPPATITVEPVATIDAGPVQTVLAGGQVKLKATASGGNSLVYSWLPIKGLSDATILDPYASPTVTTLYTLTVTSTTDALACPVTDTVSVVVLQAPVIPTAFTPNGDSVNDVWNIKYLDSYPGCSVDVYNRNGEKVFSSVGYGIPWDGRYNSVNLPVGTYYYVIDPKNGRSKMTGPVTIIR